VASLRGALCICELFQLFEDLFGNWDMKVFSAILLLIYSIDADIVKGYLMAEVTEEVTVAPEKLAFMMLLRKTDVSWFRENVMFRDIALNCSIIILAKPYKI
jgi:hypothetical protein